MVDGEDMDLVTWITVVAIPALAYISYRAGFQDGVEHTVDFLKDAKMLDVDE
jgi:hypothetical protein